MKLVLALSLVILIIIICSSSLIQWKQNNWAIRCFLHKILIHHLVKIWKICNAINQIIVNWIMKQSLKAQHLINDLALQLKNLILLKARKWMRIIQEVIHQKIKNGKLFHSKKVEEDKVLTWNTSKKFLIVNQELIHCQILKLKKKKVHKI